MIIGIPKEIKQQEYRVGLPPQFVGELIEHGHKVIVEKNAGIGSGFSNEEYENEGAEIKKSHRAIFESADLIIKVKEPLKPEISMFKKDQILFTYLHLASSKELTKDLRDTGIIGIAYETVEENGRLPLLSPMSVIAGRMAPIMGSHFLTKHHGGNGVFIGGSTGIPHGRVVIIGGGTAGVSAAKVAAGMGAQVTVLEINNQRISYLEDILTENVSIIKSNKWNIKESVKSADILIGAVLIPGARAPKVVSEELVKQMKPGAVIVDIAIDQGGCIATSRPTTHANPVYIMYNVVHYCVTNMPGAYPRTSTMALTTATLPYITAIANSDYDWKALIQKVPALEKGFNIFKNKIVYKAVADATGMEYTPLRDLL
ncbi:MAG: alanine dehydrogenase [Promethearchaeota archaeon]